MTERRRLLGLSLVLMLVVAGTAEAAERTAQEWLDYMRRSMTETSYTGTFVYRYGDRLQAMRIAHRSGVDGVRERLVTLNGPRREILRDDSEVTCILPEDQSVVVDRRQVSNPINDIVPAEGSSLAERYDLGLRGDDRIADQPVVRVAIEPKDGYRYGYELAIARESGLLLGAQLHAGDDSGPVEQILFTELEVPADIPDSALEQTTDGDGFTWHRRGAGADSAQSVAGGSDWALDAVPAGFELTMRERHTLPGRDVMVEHWLYTDGLASVSVYIERTGEGVGAFHGRSRMGALNVFGRQIGSYQVVVVGEVPAVTVESMGRAIERRSGANLD